MLEHTYNGMPVALLTTVEIEELLAYEDGFADPCTGASLSRADQAHIIARLKLELEIRALGLR
jgi:hypothetical protein